MTNFFVPEDFEQSFSLDGTKVLTSHDASILANDKLHNLGSVVTGCIKHKQAHTAIVLCLEEMKCEHPPNRINVTGIAVGKDISNIFSCGDCHKTLFPIGWKEV